MRLRTLLPLTLPAGLLVVVSACGGSADADYGWADTAGIPADYDSTSTGGDYGPGAPGEPEQEDAIPRLAPAQTDVYVFVANPDRDTVTRIDVKTQELRTLPVGREPRLVLTTPDYTRAVVFNRGEDTVSLLDAALLTQQVVEVRQDLNAMVLSPDGRYAALWHDADAERPDDPPAQGSQSFNEVSFVDVQTGDHYAMAVGFSPHGVEFTPDGTLAVVVSDDALALVDLTVTPLLPELIPVSTDLEPPRAEELILSADGQWGFLRQFGASELLVVDLKGRGLDPVPVGENPTDLDLLPDGSAAVALSRGARQLWIYDLVNPFAAPRVLGLPGEAEYGQVVFSPRGDVGLLFTNATPSDRVAIWDLTTDEITERKLVKPITGVAVTPTGGSALVFHSNDDMPLSPVGPFTGEWALTLMDLDDFRTNPLLLPAEPTGFANAESGRRGYFVMEEAPYLEVLDFETLLYEQVVLPSLPEFVGVMPDLTPDDGDEPPAWVSQEHDLGRISLYDADDGSVETITGFELNSGIETE